LHGDRDSDKPTIWTGNAEAPYWEPKALYEGDLGRVYGVQWRFWTNFNGDVIDQLAQLVDGIKKDPYGRRHILSAWNPGELDQMALPPCHMFAQFFVSKGKLSCQMYQRSADLFLGVPFNIASYSLLTHMLAQVCDLEVGEFVHILGDTHVYSNHVKQVEEQVGREPLPLPTLWLNPEIKDITKFTMNDIRLDGYQHHPSIKADMAV
jgi:thymidylate synthase